MVGSPFSDPPSGDGEVQGTFCQWRTHHHGHLPFTANPRTENLEFRAFDSSRFLISRGGIPRPVGGISQIFGVSDSYFADS